MNYDRYIGIPYKVNGRDRTGVDCYGLIHLLYKELKGIELASFDSVVTGGTRGDLRKVARAIEKEKETWVKVENPEPFDVVLLRTGKYSWHVGLVISKTKMIHSLNGTDSIIEDFTKPYWKNRVQEFRRCTM